MQVQIIHQEHEGGKTDLGLRELNHMPPIGEPFLVDDQTSYKAKAYFGPDDKGYYLLVLEGEPVPVTAAGKA